IGREHPVIDLVVGDPVEQQRRMQTRRYGLEVVDRGAAGDGVTANRLRARAAQRERRWHLMRDRVEIARGEQVEQRARSPALGGPERLPHLAAPEVQLDAE